LYCLTTSVIVKLYMLRYNNVSYGETPIVLIQPVSDLASIVWHDVIHINCYLFKMILSLYETGGYFYEN
jgi:hypothetical protein